MKLRIASAETEEDTLDITPLIDVIFLLVLFFMFTSTFIEEAKVFQVELPRADHAELIERSDMDAISISADGRLAWGEEELEGVEELLARLEKEKNEKQDWDRARPVIIRCDRKCEYMKFVQVKNALVTAGVETIFEEVGGDASK